MKRLYHYLARTLSARLSLIVALSSAVLLAVTLVLVLYFSQQIIKKEAMEKAENTLEGMVQQVDNILLSVEQSSGNVYWNMLGVLHDREELNRYCEEMVRCNPNITGCTVAMMPYYYNEREELSMFYVHRAMKGDKEDLKAPLVHAKRFGNRPYTEQAWYKVPMEKGRATWVGPLKNDDTEGHALLSFCLPIFSREGKPVGVMALDVLLERLTRIVLDAKPSANSYATLLGKDGSYIVHPDSTKLMHQTVFAHYKETPNEDIMAAAKAMVAGEKGRKMFRENGADNYVFYKPFERKAVPGRAMEETNWSAAIIYPENDILGKYKELAYYMAGIGLVGLLLLVVVCQRFAHRQLLPLRTLTRTAEHISQGHYYDLVPESQQEDEVGRLQDHFQMMQQSLARHIGELERLRASLLGQRKELKAAYKKAQAADHMKTMFLHNMTNQMMEPSGIIERDVDKLRRHWREMSEEETRSMTEEIQQQGKTITELLKDMLKDEEAEENK